ncbi:transcriptional regulator [Bacteroides sp. OttesenSCG-928-J23]|nr:transcriptional regulator [Bacteroides sp. OttesenSCG-928-N06]MDL2247290.1 transcriptional regulator [Bacteroides sp. OttesenSCG-928-J23]MDL2303857.1 transcriptional regulator [Bacteroides sp. OttesenSCG-928-D19]
MLEDFQHINRAFENKARLGIMAILAVNDNVDFNTLKEQLALTDGNLASHARALEDLKYISCKKTFVGRKPKTIYKATKKGKEAFTEHILALERFLKSDF